MITLFPQSGFVETYGTKYTYETRGLTYEPDHAKVYQDEYLETTEALEDFGDYWLYDKVSYEGHIYSINSITVEGPLVRLFSNRIH